MRKDFYIFRHGQTDLNKQNCWQGSGMNYDLNETGLVQAQGLVDKLKDKKIEFIFSSPLLRAKHTAEILAENIKVSVKVIRDLRECFYGVAEGRPIAELEKEFPKVLHDWYDPCEKCEDSRFDGGESIKEVRERILAVLENLLSEEYQTMGISIHGGTMLILANHFGIEHEKIPNCGAFHLVYENGRWFGEGGIF